MLCRACSCHACLRLAVSSRASSHETTDIAGPMPTRDQPTARIRSHALRVTEIPVRLIYNDPTRHFGGQLDDAGNRLRHYLDVLCVEQKRIDASLLAQKRVPCPCG